MKVNEIFYSLQGEGHFTGTPAVFVRLSGCNLKCDFCDTQHQDGVEMDEDEIVGEITQFPSRHIVITGGEPLLQLTGRLVDALHALGCFVQIETNGTQRLGAGLAGKIDWITCSPKYGVVPVVEDIDELKVVFDMDHPEYVERLVREMSLIPDICCLQPCDRGDAEFNRRNTDACIDYIMMHPRWTLSLQTHKMLGLR